MKGLEKELTQGKGITDLKTVARTCNDPDIIGDSLRTLFERQGVSGRVLDRVESSRIYQSILDDLTAP